MTDYFSVSTIHLYERKYIKKEVKQKMSDWLVQKYIGMISNRLNNFKRKGPSLYNFSCPICGDSEINKRKARAYIYEKEGKMVFHCHNCSKTMMATTFIKTMDQNLYDEYVMEKMKDMRSPEEIKRQEFFDKLKKPVFMKSGPLKDLKKVSQLSIYDPVKKFVDFRKIPPSFHSKLFSCPNFKHFTNKLLPNKFSEESLKRDETRLLIPYFDSEKNVFAFSSRAIGKSDVKYIKILLNEDIPNLYGLDTVDRNLPVYVFEGEIDSMFIPNSIATGGGDLISAVKSLPKENLVICYDNEPRSKETIKKLDKAIFQGYSVVIWPENLEFKDVNEMILNNLKPDFIEFILKTHTYNGIKAKLALADWNKI